MLRSQQSDGKTASYIFYDSVSILAEPQNCPRGTLMFAPSQNILIFIRVKKISHFLHIFIMCFLFLFKGCSATELIQDVPKTSFIQLTRSSNNRHFSSRCGPYRNDGRIIENHRQIEWECYVAGVERIYQILSCQDEHVVDQFANCFRDFVINEGQKRVAEYVEHQKVTASPI